MHVTISRDVTVDGVSVGAVSSYTITNVTTPHTIIASFAPNGPYTINASAGAGGSISPSGFMTVGCNGSQTFTDHAGCMQSHSRRVGRQYFSRRSGAAIHLAM
jgi:hypothetical protein